MPINSFLAQLAPYKRVIDEDIAAYALEMRTTTKAQYGQSVLDAETDIFLDMLARGGKRLRGALTMVGYEMCGGTNRAMIVQAARAIEMLHAYILIIDDIQDRSTLRRGKATAHEMLAAYHKKHGLRGDSRHAGISLALMSGIAGGHVAQSILANLDARPELRTNVLSIVNRTMAITAHGQTMDIMNELVEHPTLEDIDRVLEWKTALYTIINPLHVGMVLAGAGCEQTDAITPFATHIGKAFQITDDILGIFGEEKELGKLPGDDIREGKGTLLTAYALQHASPEEAVFLRRCLGNPELTAEEFEQCKHIIEHIGALAEARYQAGAHITQALESFEATKGMWQPKGAEFLQSLALALQKRVS